MFVTNFIFLCHWKKYISRYVHDFFQNLYFIFYKNFSCLKVDRWEITRPRPTTARNSTDSTLKKNLGLGLKSQNFILHRSFLLLNSCREGSSLATKLPARPHCNCGYCARNKRVCDRSISPCSPRVHSAFPSTRPTRLTIDRISQLYRVFFSLTRTYFVFRGCPWASTIVWLNIDLSPYVRSYIALRTFLVILPTALYSLPFYT